jgi:hypothetical protein
MRGARVRDCTEAENSQQAPHPRLHLRSQPQDLYVAVTKATLGEEVVPKEKHVRSELTAGGWGFLSRQLGSTRVCIAGRRLAARPLDS